MMRNSTLFVNVNINAGPRYTRFSFQPMSSGRTLSQTSVASVSSGPRHAYCTKATMNFVDSTSKLTEKKRYETFPPSCDALTVRFLPLIEHVNTTTRTHFQPRCITQLGRRCAVLLLHGSGVTVLTFCGKCTAFIDCWTIN